MYCLHHRLLMMQFKICFACILLNFSLWALDKEYRHLNFTKFLSYSTSEIVNPFGYARIFPSISFITMSLVICTFVSAVIEIQALASSWHP